MAGNILGAYINVESSSQNGEPSEAPSILIPQRVVAKTYHSVPQALVDPIEMKPLQWGMQQDVPDQAQTAMLSGAKTATMPIDLEMSRPASPVLGREGVEVIQSWSNPPMNRFRMAAVSLANFCGGLSDSAPGALIPYIERDYNIGYAIVSIIFITNAIGFILAAFVVDALRARLGRSRTMILANALMCCCYVPVICTPPFPLITISFFFSGMGAAINLALGNVFAANLQNGTHMLGFMHGSYGIGGTIGPLIATTMVTSGFVWSRYYILPLGVAIFNSIFAGWSFWRYERESFSSSTLLSNAGGTTLQTQDSATIKSQICSMTRAVRSKVVLLGAIFIFAYQGSEVSISGWVVSFLISSRNGDPSSVGYVTAGFWCGITIGRFFLSQPAHRLGEKISVYFIIAGAAAFQLLIWLVPNIIGDAVAVAIVGLLLGPVYPCATVIFSRAIPRKAQVSSLGVISAFGSSGGAVAPFLVGILAQVSGTFVLHPIAIGLFAVMLGCWLAIPDVKKRAE